MKRKLLGLLLALFFLFPPVAFGQAFRREQKALVVIPSTNVTSIGTTTSAEFSGAAFNSAIVNMRITVLTPPNTLKLNFLIFDPATDAFKNVYTSPTQDATGNYYFCFSLRSCASGLPLPGVVHVPLPFPRRYKFSVTTSTTDSITFLVGVTPFESN